MLARPIDENEDYRLQVEKQIVIGGREHENGGGTPKNLSQ
jgi:hypothetical protein